MTSTDDLDDILEGLTYEDLQALSDEIDPEVRYSDTAPSCWTALFCANINSVLHIPFLKILHYKPKLVPS